MGIYFLRNERSKIDFSGVDAIEDMSGTCFITFFTTDEKLYLACYKTEQRKISPPK